MNCSCNFICGLSDVIIKTFSQSVSTEFVHRPLHALAIVDQARRQVRGASGAYAPTPK